MKIDVIVKANLIKNFSETKPNISLYQEDKGIEFDLNVILDDGYRKIYLLENIDKNCIAKVKIINQSTMEENIIKNIKISDNKICFIITEEIQKYVNKIGRYTLQFTIYNELDFNFTITPFEIEIKKKIGSNNILKRGD